MRKARTFPLVLRKGCDNYEMRLIPVNTAGTQKQVRLQKKVLERGI
jgi:hypothetical protein